MPVSEGNRLIFEVQDQRLAGTIDKVIPGSERHKIKALAWLRKNVPFDEDRAILKRLEREEQAALRPQGQQKGGNVYAGSVLDQIRAENRAKYEKKKKEEEAKAKLEPKRLPLSPEQALVQRREESLAWVQKWHANARKDDLHSLPQMSFIKRVGPATLLALTVISLCVMFAQNYSPPSEAARLFTKIVSIPECWLTLLQRLISEAVHEDIGRGPFLAVYLSCGIAASNIFLISTVLRKRWEYVTLGCSGALSGILASWCWINSDKGVRIWPLPPRATEALQPIAVLALFVAVDAWGVWKGLRFGRLKLDTRIDHVSHLAGYSCGIVAAQFLQPSAKPQQGKRAERLATTGPKMQRIENTTDY
ncbi:MAG: hypothetical protein Q9211_004546 [Gyalolechia sp. 1 TL-2023]